MPIIRNLRHINYLFPTVEYLSIVEDNYLKQWKPENEKSATAAKIVASNVSKVSILYYQFSQLQIP